MGKSNIEWTDYTWNPVTGCTAVSPGCDNCYARRMSRRLAANPVLKAEARKKYEGFKVARWPERLGEPLALKNPRRIFVVSMGDLFHESVPYEWVDQVMAVATLCPSHTFRVLTKRPARMLEYSKGYMRRNHDILFTARKLVPQSRLKIQDACWPLSNVHLGVTAEKQEQADARIPILLQTPAAVRFVSYEPALGPVDFKPYLSPRPGHPVCKSCVSFNKTECPGVDPKMPESVAQNKCSQCHDLMPLEHRNPILDGIIAGGESGPGARPAHPDWFRSVRDQCSAAQVPFFFKQWGEWLPVIEGAEWIAHSDKSEKKLRDIGGTLMAHVGKKAAGRLLDGREHNELPGAKS